MLVIQRIFIALPNETKISAEITRYPNGHGCLWDAWYWANGARKESYSASKEEVDFIMEAAAKEWDEYFNCDPRCAQGWIKLNKIFAGKAE